MSCASKKIFGAVARILYVLEEEQDLDCVLLVVLYSSIAKGGNPPEILQEGRGVSSCLSYEC